MAETTRDTWQSRCYRPCRLAQACAHLAALAAVSSCEASPRGDDRDDYVTGFEVVARFDPDLKPDLITYAAHLVSGEVVLPPTAKPIEVNQTGTSGLSMVVLVWDSLGGQSIDVSAEIQRGGAWLAGGRGRVQLVAGKVVSALVDLSTAKSCVGDSDGDAVCDSDDICYGDNASGDTDADGICDDVDACPIDSADDSDGDTVCDSDERACGSDPHDAGSLPLDDDGDGECNALDACVGDDAMGDSDGDATCNDLDTDDDDDGWTDREEAVCLSDPRDAASTPLGSDDDRDGVCNALDPCAGANESGDTDGDATCNDLDTDDDDDGWTDDDEAACLTDPQDAASTPGAHDDDDDGVCDELDSCAGDDAVGDSDGDGTCDDRDSDDDDDGWTDDEETACSTDPRDPASVPADFDADGDGVCDALDACEGNDAVGDLDGDAVCNDVDTDDDGDGWSDVDEIACNSYPWQASVYPPDGDRDGVCNANDVCIGVDATGDEDADGVCKDLDPGWGLRADLPRPAMGLTSAVLNDGLHVLGGAGEWAGQHVVQDHYVYDPVTDTWSTAPAETPDKDVWGAQAHAYENRLYLVGGWKNGKRLRVYDPALDSWQQLEKIPEAFKYGFVSAIVGDHLYVMGGEPGPAVDAPAYKLDLVTLSWSPCASIPHNDGDGALSGAAVGGRIYVLNGDEPGGGTILQIYNTSIDLWSMGAGLSAHHDGSAAIAWGSDVYFFGGISSHNTDLPATRSKVNIYNTANNRWRNGIEMPTARAWMTVQRVGRLYHVIGGTNDGETAVATHALYGP